MTPPPLAGWLGAATVANADATYCAQVVLAINMGAPSGQLSGPERSEHAWLVQQGEQQLRLSESFASRLRPWLPKFLAAMLEASRSENRRLLHGGGAEQSLQQSRA